MMRKLLIVVAVLALPGMLMAQGVLAAPNVSINPGETLTLDVTLTGPVSIPGVEVNLQIGNGAWDLDNNVELYTGGPRILSVDLVGPGTVLATANNGQVDVVMSSQMIWSSTQTTSGRVTVGEGQTAIFARLTIDAGDADKTPVGSVWPLSLTSLNGATNYADDQGILFPTLVDGTITITPEPASAMLLLGALPLLRRRH